MPEEKLKPCPFCGGKAILFTKGFKEEDKIAWRVICKCGAKNWFYNWNRREGEDRK